MRADVRAAMIYLKCECGSGLGVPGSFLNEPVRCEDCGRSLRLVAGRDLSDREAANWRLEVVSGPGGAMQGEHILLGGTAPIEVGGGLGKHLPLAGKFVSPDHCRLVPTDDGWRLTEDSPRIQNDKDGPFMKCPHCARRIAIMRERAAGAPGFEVAAGQKCDKILGPRRA